MSLKKLAPEAQSPAPSELDKILIPFFREYLPWKELLYAELETKLKALIAAETTKANKALLKPLANLIIKPTDWTYKKAFLEIEKFVKTELEESL